MKDFLNRLKSPVVIIQIISIIATIIVATHPELNDTVEKIVYSLTVIINCFSGLNNPTNKSGF